jgi:hypothetical protein
MIESGLIAKNADGKFSLCMEKTDAFYAGMREMFSTMVRIYDEYDTALAKNLLATKAVETPLVLEMFEIVKAVK